MRKPDVTTNLADTDAPQLHCVVPDPIPESDYIAAIGNLPELETALEAARIPETAVRSQYTQVDRVQAIGLYTVFGTLAAVSERTGIPATTLRDWRNSDWWEAGKRAIRRYRGERLDARLSQVQDLAIDNVIDRLVRGDVGKTGERYPMTGRNAAVILDIASKNLALIRLQPTSITAGSSDSKIQAMAQRFEQLSAQVEARVVSEQPQALDSKGND